MLKIEAVASKKEALDAKQPSSPTAKNNTCRNYEHYFLSGVYKHRYPKANRCTLNFVQQYISNKTKPTHILDYGCGSGRYLLALLSQHRQTLFTAYDIAKAPLEILKNSLKELNQLDRVSITHGVEQLKDNTFDLSLLLFGVLSHISSKSERQQLLALLRDSIAERDGYLLISVPNKQRRFIRLQRQQQNHEITYCRTLNEQSSHFYYHLYSVDSITKELDEADLTVINMQAESFLPESWVTRFSTLGWLDQQLCKVIPASWGYGILICCRDKKRH